MSPTICWFKYKYAVLYSSNVFQFLKFLLFFIFQLLRLDLTAGGKSSEGLTGYVLNLMTTDAQRFDMASLFLIDLVKAPLESIVVVYIMYLHIGVATLIGVAFLLLFIPLQGEFLCLLTVIKINKYPSHTR